MFRLLFICIVMSLGLSARAQSSPSEMNMAVPDSAVTDSVHSPRFYEKGFIGKIYNYFKESNVERPEKKFDMSFIGGPHYSSEEGFGIGLAGSGRYRAGNFENKETPWSNVTLKLDVTTGQMYKIGMEGYHIFERDIYRINYDVYFYSFKDKWWGIGYDFNSQDSTECSYKRLQSEATADFVFQLSKGIFLGPLGQFAYCNASRIAQPWLLQGQASRIFNFGLGATFLIDRRDIPTAATRGYYFRLDVLAFPKFLANKSPYTFAELTASTYHNLWKGGIIAANFHTALTWGDTPWCRLPDFGGSSRMRGYWEGRYRDKMEADITLELRQNVWRRSGVALWVGAGSVFPRFSEFTFRHVLPNFGIGYRWEFKKGVNVRLDLGFGRHEKGINFSLNEAF